MKKEGSYRVGSLDDVMGSQWFSDMVEAQSNKLMRMMDIEQTQEHFNIIHTAFGGGYLYALNNLVEGKIGVAKVSELMEGFDGKARSN